MKHAIKQESVKVNFKGQIENSQRKQWNSIIPIFKEIIDNSRDANASIVDIQLFNYLSNKRITTDGGTISIFDNGDGLPPSSTKGVIYDWEKCLELHRPKDNKSNNTAGQNGIGLKDSCMTLGNKFIMLTKSKNKPIEFVYFNLLEVENEIKYYSGDFNTIESINSIPKQIKEHTKNKILNWNEQDSSGFGIIIFDTHESVFQDGKNTFWDNNDEPKDIDALKQLLLNGNIKKEQLPISMFYPQCIKGYNQPDIIVNTTLCKKITNPEAVYCDENGDLQELDLLDNNEFDQEYNREFQYKNTSFRSSYFKSDNKRQLLSKGGLTITRGGTVVDFCLQCKAFWKLQDQRSRRLNINMSYSDVEDFDDDWGLTKNKQIKPNSSFKQQEMSEQFDNFASPLFNKINDFYKNDSNNFEKSDEKTILDMQNLLQDFHVENFTTHSGQKREKNNNTVSTTGLLKNTNSISKNSTSIRGINIVELDDMNPIESHSIEESNNGNGMRISIYLRHNKIVNFYTRKKQQLSFIIDIYANHVSKNDFSKYRKIKDDLENIVSQHCSEEQNTEI